MDSYDGRNELSKFIKFPHKLNFQKVYKLNFWKNI